LTIQIQEIPESMKYFPHVRTSKIEFQDFDADRIKNSLARETGLNEDKAKEIAIDVATKIERMGLSFLSAP